MEVYTSGGGLGVKCQKSGWASPNIYYKANTFVLCIRALTLRTTIMGYIGYGKQAWSLGITIERRELRYLADDNPDRHHYRNEFMNSINRHFLLDRYVPCFHCATLTIVLNVLAEAW